MKPTCQFWVHATTPHWFFSDRRDSVFVFVVEGGLKHKATHIWKFIQHHFIASKLNAGCSGYLDKICKIIVDILDLKAGFPLANFFIQSNFFRSKTIKSRIEFYFFYFEKKSLTNENSARSHFVWKNLQVENWLHWPS